MSSALRLAARRRIRICRRTIARDAGTSHRIGPAATGIGAVPFDGRDDFTVTFLDDTDMLQGTSAPSEEDDISRRRLIRPALPLVSRLEPVRTVAYEGKLRNGAALEISALIRAPGNEAGAPLHAGMKPVPGPEFGTAFVAELCPSDVHDVAVS